MPGISSFNIFNFKAISILISASYRFIDLPENFPKTQKTPKFLQEKRTKILAKIQIFSKNFVKNWKKNWLLSKSGRQIRFFFGFFPRKLPEKSIPSLFRWPDCIQGVDLQFPAVSDYFLDLFPTFSVPTHHHLTVAWTIVKRSSQRCFWHFPIPMSLLHSEKSIFLKNFITQKAQKNLQSFEFWSILKCRLQRFSSRYSCLPELRCRVFFETLKLRLFIYLKYLKKINPWKKWKNHWKWVKNHRKKASLYVFFTRNIEN